MEILAEAVKYFIGKKEILKGIDLTLHPKEFLGIIGPNGSGKSTFLKCVYRVQKPTEGTIRFDGKLLDEMSYRESALKLAVVAQHNYYNFDFSVLDVVLMGRSPHKKMMDRDNAEDYRLAHESLSIVGLSGFEARNFSTLSGGEQLDGLVDIIGRVRFFIMLQVLPGRPQEAGEGLGVIPVGESFHSQLLHHPSCAATGRLIGILCCQPVVRRAILLPQLRIQAERRLYSAPPPVPTLAHRSVPPFRFRRSRTVQPGPGRQGRRRPVSRM